MSEQDNVQAQTDVDGYYKIDVRDNNVYLKVVSPEGRGERIRYQSIIEDLRNRDIKEYDKELVKKLVTERSGEEALIGKHFPKDAQVQVNISKNGLEATIKVLPPEVGAEGITKDGIKKALSEAGVIFGIKESVIDEIVAQQRYDQIFVIAEGIPVKDGEDSSIEYKVDIDKEKPKIKVNEDTGSVDLRELNLIENVVDGQLLAVKIPSKSGEPGITVENKHIPPKQGKDYPLPAGKNTRVSEDGLEIYATANGMVQIAAGKINVESVYVINGNVNNSTGNIDFIGSVIVNGSVEDGFKVKAEGNIEVKQTVGKGAILEAEGNITVQQGIVGHNEAIVRAGGNVKARHIQEANVFAAGDVFVSEAIMHANIEAGERVIMYGKKGLIVGGNIVAYKEVNAKTVGSQMSTKTSIEVGIRPAIRVEVQKIEEEISKDKKSLEQVEQGLTTLLRLRKMKKELPPDKHKLLLQLGGVREGLKKKLGDLMSRYDELQEVLKTKIPAKVCVSGDTFQGVKIAIRNISIFTTKQNTFCTFFEEGGEIKTRTYDEARIDKKELE